MSSFLRIPPAPVFVLALASTSCIPFTVGSTAQPLSPGESTRAMSVYSVPNSFDMDSTRSYPRFGVDAETRFGIDDRSDVGIRVPSYSGVVVNYKRRINGASVDPGVAVAILGGAGLVNLGEHAHFELTFLASAQQSAFTPYGGLRAMQVVPINRGALRDSPTLGGFAGLRIAYGDLAISPELGVFYDHSTLGIRKGNVIVVPAVTLSQIGRRHRF